MANYYGSPVSLTAELSGPYGGSSSGSGGGTVAKIVDISLASGSWKGANSPYSQTVTVSGVSANSVVDLAASASVLNTLWEMGTAISLENDGGTVTAYAIGQKPTKSLTLQAIITEGVVTT